jgi:hypothetical protein
MLVRLQYAAIFDAQITLQPMKAGGAMSNIHPDFC